MDLEKIQQLIHVFESSSLSEIEIAEEGFRMRLKKPRPKTVVSPNVAALPIAAPMVQTQFQALAAEPPEKPGIAPREDKDVTTINSPMVGTFYVAPAPGEPPFVEPGDTVDENQTVCIVEAMKLMNEVTAKFPALIEKVLVENGEPVEYAQPLFQVRRIEQV